MFASATTMSSTWLSVLLTILTVLAFGTADSYRAALDTMEAKNDKVVACYVASWVSYRGGDGKFDVNNLRPELCTHLIYAFAGLNHETWEIKIKDPWKDVDEDGKGYYKKMTELKYKYDGLKVSIAVGGYNEGSGNFSLMAASPAKRKLFVASAVKFLARFDFDGLDLDWEFPAEHDKDNLVQLVKELQEAFASKKYLLTAATSANPDTLRKGYDLVELSKYLDYIHIMAYDYHGTWDRQILPNAPLNATDGLSVVDTVTHFLNVGVPPEKIVLGLPMYGRTFYLVTEISADQSPIGKPCREKGFAGQFSTEAGFLGYHEICMELNKDPDGWHIGWDNASTTPYMINGDRVVSFDNKESIAAKVNYSMEKKLGGAMVWSIDTDDFHGYCAKLNTNSEKASTETDFPLMRTINDGLGRFGGSTTDSGNGNGVTTTKKPNKKPPNSAARYGVSLGLITLSMVVLSWFS